MQRVSECGLRNLPQLCCALLLCLASSGVAPAKSQRNQTKTQEELNLFLPNGQLLEQLQKLPPSQRLKITEELVSKGLFLNIPETWKSIKELEFALKAIRQFPEPFTDAMLETLERTLPQSTNSQKRIDASALLYRYDRQAGRDYLVAEFNQSQDVTIATIFALNRETEFLDDILRILAAANGDYRNDPLLIHALGTWKNQKIEEALFRQFQVALAAKQDGYANFAPALAAQNSQRSIPLLEKLYQVLSEDDSIHASTKFTVAAALIRLKAKKSDRLIKLMAASLKTKERAFSHSAIVRALGQSWAPEAITILRQLISDYLQMGTPPSPRYGETVEETDSDELAVLAAEQLAYVEDTESYGLILKLFQRLGKDEQTRSRAIPELREQTARALLNLNTRQTQIVERSLGKEWMQREQAIRKLKPLPDTIILS